MAMTNAQLHKIVFLLGSNQGNKSKNLENARQLIDSFVGKIKLVSSIYETEPWGFESTEAFLNQAVLVESSHEHDDVLKAIQKIEKDMGRDRILNFYTSRVIDIDIIFIDQLVINQPDLTIPHPLIQLRKFVLIPLNEIIPKFIHPVLDISITQMLGQCEDTLKVEVA